VKRLRERQEWQFFSVLPRADPVLALAWWLVLAVRGVLPAVFAIAMGVLVAAVQRHADLAAPLVLAGVVFVLLQVIAPIQTAIGANLADRTAAWLYDRLTEACIRPAGLAHLEDPTLTSDLTMARDFDLGAMGPPLSLSMAFIASGLVDLIGGLALTLVLAAQERGAQASRLARHLFVLSTTAPPAKEVRVTGIGPRLLAQRRAAWERWYSPIAAARVGTAVWNSLAWAVFVLAYVGAVAFVSSGLRASAGAVLLVLAAGARLSAYVGATMGEIGYLRGIWLDGSRRLAWLEDYAAALVAHADLPVPDCLRTGIRFEHVSFAYPGTERLVLDDVNLDLRAGSVVAIVGENGAGKSTVVKLLAKLYEPTGGQILVDGADLARLPADAGRAP
jgi:ATP-binding cassette subfamily B protein